MPNRPRKGKAALVDSSLSDPMARSVESLTELFVRRVQDLSGRVTSTSRDDPVILDLNVSGVRCVLIRSQPQQPTVSLSPREKEIARLVAKGYPNKTIGAILEISSWTVCTHLRRIFSKLGVGSRAAMVAQLIGKAIISEAPHPSRVPHAER